MRTRRARAIAAAVMLAAAVIAVPHATVAAGPDTPLGTNGDYLQVAINHGTDVGSAGTWTLTAGRYDASDAVLAYDLHLELEPAGGFESGPIAVFWAVIVNGAIPDFGDIESEAVEPGQAAAVQPRCGASASCAADLTLRTSTEAAMELVRTFESRGDERVWLELAFTVVRSLGGGTVLQVLPVSGSQGNGRTLGQPGDMHGRFFRYGFIPVDQDFTNSGQGRPKDVLALFQRSVARAGLSPAAGHAPEWRAVVLDFEVRNCFLVRAAVADAAEDQTMALKLPDNGRVSTTGVVPAGDGWSVVVTNDDEFSSVVTIPASFQSVRVGGSLGCEDGGTDGMVVSDGGPIEAHPPRLPVLPPTDASFEPASPVSPAPAPGDAPLLFAALGALAAALWWRRRSDAQSGSAARSG